MATGLPTIHRRRHQFLKALHLFYAGLFALVLPLICWGAQATPGHPHARAHFVFVDPLPIGDEHANAAELPLHTDGAAHQADHTHPQPLPSSKLPAGRSTPSLLGITLLTLVGMGAVVAPFWSTGPSFYCWLAPLWVMPLTIVIPTPPPRISFLLV